MGKTAGDTSVSGKLKDASEFAKRAIEQGVAFVPGAPFYAADADMATLRLSFATADLERFWRGLVGWGGRRRRGLPRNLLAKTFFKIIKDIQRRSFNKMRTFLSGMSRFSRARQKVIEVINTRRIRRPPRLHKRSPP